MQSLLPKLKNFIVTLRFSILSIFITFFVLTILLLISLEYVRSSKSMLFIANKLMNEVSETVIRDLNNRMVWSQDGSKLTAQLIQEGVLSTQDDLEFVTYLLQVIQRLELAQAAFWGDEAGHFVFIEREPDGQIVVRLITPGPKPTHKIFSYRNINGKPSPLRRVTTNINYDPRTRPWYIAAKNKGAPIWTEVYNYAFGHGLGITTASPVYNKNGKLRGVFGLDIRLDFISKFIKSKAIGKNGTTFIVTTDGDMLSFLTLEDFQNAKGLVKIASVKPRWIAESFKIYKKTGRRQFSFRDQGETYLASYTLVPSDISKNWLVGIVVPQDDFTAELKRASMIDAIIGLLVLALGIFCVSKLVTRVVNPIKKLVKKTEHIKRFELNNDVTVQSRIKEVILLSDAVRALQNGLKSFQKYVPASLVRQLIEAGENAHIGGAKKNLVIFFSDIQNFTGFSEEMDPNKLMLYMCEYFDELTQVITEQQGTIDKYIGDSLMAFWGAPVTIQDPGIRAAQAALECLQRLDELNKLWKSLGKQPLVTRIGLHVGEVVVGNVGSSERINYTALGDPINVTSRLEELNKTYGTRILISESLYQLIQHYFVVRKVDHVGVRGKSQTFNIYELLGEDVEEIAFDITQYNTVFEKAFLAYQHQEWDAAIALFEQCLTIYPDDTVARVFIMRCQAAKINPPAQWDGVFRYKG